MKILHVITRSDLGGAQNVVLNLANAMCKEHEVIVVAGENGPMWEGLDSKVNKIKVYDIVREISFWKDLKAYFKLKKVYNDFKPDVIHLHSSKIGVLGRLAFPPKKIVYSVHGFDSIRLAYRKFLPLEKLLKNRCKAIVLASNYDKNNMIAENINKNLYVIHNGAPIPDKSLKASLDISANYTKKILCIARISPQKRFDSFVNIAKILPDYAFVWIGGDNYLADSPPNLFCLKSISDAKRYIMDADIFVLPSNYEGIPIVIVDALSYSKPVVSSDVGGISEIVFNGENGYVLENDENIFAEKIQYILENQDIYAQFCKKSFSIFSENLTIEKMVEKYLKIYKK